MNPAAAKRRLCFAHMQKSGGSSAHDFIIRSFRADPSWNDGQYLRIWSKGFVPSHFDEIRRGERRFVYGHFDPSRLFEAFDGVFFTIARDPVERVISLYNFCATMDDETLSGITGVRDDPAFTFGTPETYSLATDMISMIDVVRDGLSFENFIRLPERLFLGLESWSDYLAYLPKRGNPTEYASRFALIGLSDDMAWTLSELALLMGWPAPSSTPHVNRTPRNNVTRADLTVEDVAIIEGRTQFETTVWNIARARRRALATE